jgi:LCP family protein required for cell wall assembly
MRPPFDTPPQPPRRRWPLWSFAAVVTVVMIFGGYTLYRVVSFTDSVFAGSRPPRDVAAVADEPAAEATPEPTAVPTVAARPTEAATVAPPAAPPTATARPRATPVDAATLPGKLQAGQRVTLLLFGYGGGSHDGTYLTDAIVVASYDPRTRVLALFNIPRDLWVPTPTGDGRLGPYRKINEIYSVGLGPGALTGTVRAEDQDRAAWSLAGAARRVVGLPIDGWVSGDFTAVRKVVDGLGGVVVDVERTFDDYEYPRNDNKAIDTGTIHLHFDAGPQRMTGERALQYARSRHSAQDGGDFGRSRRQQRLLLALKDQLATPAALPRVFTLMEAVQGNLRTSLSLDEARALLLLGRDLNGSVQATTGLIDTTTLLVSGVNEHGGYILSPRGGLTNYAPIHRHVQETMAGAVALEQPGRPR